MQKGFMHELEANVLSDNDDSKVFLVPSKKEHLAVKIDKNVLDRLKDDEKLERMLKNLLKMNSKRTTKETVNINKRNYRIFL
ncbi:hypothetical protein JCM15457_9 [Liquorilactobacillus sucicola DSM 21376 = JCM 15457]|uniref:Uncharacterized protein n=1 Tax=Liquorilactobacillus sucicola DSM 21376 = JCM 15457 TaxID=1423806 RepID=A0A023CTU0_9LACO|nr:hypothetical protein [Liquorilactobacillus sucicola]KRN05111.1 hypothetical protein FD15_GL001653 [Liquorilactobacillus sucicola DSM 21376 = JCM 15457]GAJ25158.1 hypothetical protein JCM15457_9 [Liquorilactobacillus sucicola DSM 21376 = JCM 15457]